MRRYFAAQDLQFMPQQVTTSAPLSSKVNVRGREVSEQIRGEWQASTQKIRPPLSRIAATDRLTHPIVYRLYGLSEETMALR